MSILFPAFTPQAWLCAVQAWLATIMDKLYSIMYALLLLLRSEFIKRNSLHGDTAFRPAYSEEFGGREGIDSRGGQAYAAAAMSLVFHSAHPHIPTLRADVRLFQVAGISWFGGGCDLTPFYIDEADASNFHSFWKAVCDKHQEGLYSTLKQECDKCVLGAGLSKARSVRAVYFYLPARGEHRGIGGLFFDDMEKGTEGASSKGGFDAEAFTRDVGKGILDSWVPIAGGWAGEQ
eukprot:scaffold90069_cov17-Tisochrysis_lutea.AAC.2